MIKERCLEISSPKEMSVLGERLAKRLFPGAVAALIGTLGAGKTHLVRAIAETLGADPRRVSSPTFVLIQEYDAQLPIYHFDAYRLGTSAQFRDLGVHEYFQMDGVCLIEWADKVRDVLPSEYLEIRLEITGDERRDVRLTAFGVRYEVILQRL